MDIRIAINIETLLERIRSLKVDDKLRERLCYMGTIHCKGIIDEFSIGWITGLKVVRNPWHFWEPLKGDHAGLWRYCVGEYRILCEIQDQKIVVLALTIGHRRQIYKSVASVREWPT